MKQEHFITAGVSALAVACYWMETLNASALPLARENQIMSLILICLMIVYLVMCLVVIRQKRRLKQICTHPRTSFDPLGWPTGEDLEVCDVCGKSRTHWEQGQSEWCDIGNIAEERRKLQKVLDNFADFPRTNAGNAFAIFIKTMCKLEHDHEKAQRQIARDSRLLQIIVIGVGFGIVLAPVIAFFVAKVL